MHSHQSLIEHYRLTRQYFLRLGIAGAAAFQTLPLSALDGTENADLRLATDDLPTWLTSQDDFKDVSRGNPKPHTLSKERRIEVGLSRETWKLNVVSDPNNPSRLRKELSEADNSAFTFDALMRLAKTKAVSFPKVMTCLNIGCPLGNGIWEGVPLRDVLWMTQPTGDLRRVIYHGYHNDDDSQLFRSSLPVGRVLEDPIGLPPVILCYKLNGKWLSPERGGPVRMVVPETYGFKSIKWLSHVYLSNLPHANDTYAEKNNDVDSPMKTFCQTLSVPEKCLAGQPIAITGWAQSGISGLKKVQVWIADKTKPWEGEKYFTDAPWQDAQILPAPDQWDQFGWEDQAQTHLPEQTHGFKGDTPKRWPLRLTRAHWAILHPGLPAGNYNLRCRTIDEQSNAQPMPRPFRKSGHAAIQMRPLTIE